MDLKNIFNDKFIGEIKNADIKYEYKSNSCSDDFYLTIKLKENKIVDIKYYVYGCIGLMSGLFYTCELIINKEIKDIIKLTEKDILDYIGDYPEERKDCILKMFSLFPKIFVDFV